MAFSLLKCRSKNGSVPKVFLNSLKYVYKIQFLSFMDSIKNACGWGSALDPVWGAYHTPPNVLVSWDGGGDLLLNLLDTFGV